MSFDLYFYTERSAANAFESLRNLLRAEKLFSIDEAAQQIWYKNPITGAYFSLDYQDPSIDPEENPKATGDFQYVGLSFNLNYNRPLFFALEAFPWAERIASEFGYLALNPQSLAASDNTAPKPCFSNELVASWNGSNAWAVQALCEDQGDPVPYRYLPREQALFWWEYTRLKDRLQVDLGQHVFVPSLMVLQKGEQSQLHRAVVWPHALPQVFPPCDLVIRMTSHRNWRGKEITEHQIVPYKEVLARLGPLAQPLPAGPPGLRVLSPKEEPRIRKAFDGLSGPVMEGYHSVASDEYVDVPIAERLGQPNG